VLCYTPQPFTVRTTELSQILRISKKSLMSAMRAHVEDGRVIMNNLFMVSKNDITSWELILFQRCFHNDVNQYELIS